MRILRFIFESYPVTRGMAVYAVLWPSSDLCRQAGAAGLQSDKYLHWNIVLYLYAYTSFYYRLTVDIPRLVRFSLFGSLWVAPTVYVWVRIASRLVPGTTIMSAIKKAVIEQFTYGPFSIVAFYFGMSTLEGKTNQQSIEEVKHKFLPTWKVTQVCFQLYL